MAMAIATAAVCGAESGEGEMFGADDAVVMLVVVVLVIIIESMLFLNQLNPKSPRVGQDNGAAPSLGYG